MINGEANKFLSTLSLRRATTFSAKTPAEVWDFYPRSPCGERPSQLFPVPAAMAHFYPRSPCGERQTSALPETSALPFLSTLSLRRATWNCDIRPKRNFISIHALLAESDAATTVSNQKTVIFLSTLSLRRATLTPCAALTPELYFYPRSPCGEQLCKNPIPCQVWQFLSTLSLRRATHNADIFFCNFAISIHALLAESDRHAPVYGNAGIKFLSTLSLRRATCWNSRQATVHT